MSSFLCLFLLLGSLRTTLTNGKLHLSEALVNNNNNHDQNENNHDDNNNNGDDVNDDDSDDDNDNNQRYARALLSDFAEIRNALHVLTGVEKYLNEARRENRYEVINIIENFTFRYFISFSMNFDCLSSLSLSLRRRATVPALFA